MNLSMSTEEIRTRYKQLSPSQDRIGILADLNGTTKTEIEEVLGLISKPGVKRNRSWNAWTAEEDRRFRELMESGTGIYKVAKELGRSIQACKARAVKHGLTTGGGKEGWRKWSPRWTDEDKARLIEMAEKGTTPEEVAKIFDRSVNAVKQKALILGHPFKDTGKEKCESGVCEVGKETGKPSFKAELQTPVNVPGLIALPKVGEVVPAVGKLILPNLVVEPEKLPEPITPSETVKSLSLSMEFITDQLNQIIEYADNLRQENDRLTRQLARVREAVE